MSAGKLILRDGKLDAWSPYLLTPSLLKAWWNPDSHGTTRMTDDGSGVISSWTDIIGGMAITATTTARPTWASNSFNSSYAGLTFDNVANCLVSTTLTSLPTGSTAGEIWALVKLNDFTATGIIAGYGGTGGANMRRLQATPLEAVGISDGSTALTASSNSPGQTALILGGYWSGTTEGGRINGADFSPTVTTTIATLNTTTTRMRVGANNGTSATSFSAITLRHLIITTTLSTAQRQQLEGWLAWDANLTSVLPSNHPYKLVAP